MGNFRISLAIAPEKRETYSVFCGWTGSLSKTEIDAFVSAGPHEPFITLAAARMNSRPPAEGREKYVCEFMDTDDAKRLMPILELALHRLKSVADMRP